MSYGAGTKICGNDIVNTPYTAIHLGYGWDEVKKVCTRDTRICNNLIDTFMNKLFDGGGIYTLGATGGTGEHPNIIEGNFLRNQKEPKFGALYFDEGSCRWTAKDNVFQKTPMWAHISVVSPNNNNISISGSYITEGYLLFDKSNRQENIVIEEPVLCDEVDFGEKAERIISHAGLQGKYAALRADYNRAGCVKLIHNEIALEKNQRIKLDYVVRSVRGVLLRGGFKGEFFTDNAQIAEVNGKNELIAKKDGICKLILKVTDENRSFTDIAPVYVGDVITSVFLGIDKSKMKKGRNGTVKLIASSRFGRKFEINDYSLQSCDDTLRVDGKHSFTANKTGTGILTASYGGLKARKRIEVVDAPNGDPLNDSVYWWNNDCSVLTEENGIRLECDEYRGYANYMGKKLGDLTLEFELKLKANANDWPAIFFRGQDYTKRPIEKGTKAYMIVINHEYIEPQRFVDGKRTVFYGKIPGFIPATGKYIGNQYIRQEEKCRVKCGVINVNNGVRIFMEVDGKTVFDYLDGASDAIREDGYFGIGVNTGYIELKNL
jgi:hypothetical protein